MRAITQVLKIVLCCLFSIAATNAATTDIPEGLILRFVDRPEAIQYHVSLTTDAFPETLKGKDISYTWLPKLKFRLTEFVVLANEEPVFIPWGFKYGGINNDWTAIEKAFEAEMLKVYGPKSPSPSGTNTKSIIPGSIEVELSHDDLKRLGTASSIICAKFPNKITAIVAVVAGVVVALDEELGKKGMVVGFNPYVGVGYAIPKNLEGFSRDLVDQLSATAKKEPSVALIRALSDGKISKIEIRQTLIPGAALGISPKDIKSAKKALEKLRKRIPNL